MDGFMAAAALLPGPLRRAALGMEAGERERCEEFRLRRGREATVLAAGRERCLCPGPVTEAVVRAVLETATGASLHAAGEQLRRGFVSAPGGVRVGVCGTAVLGGGTMEGVRQVSSLAIRVPRAVPGCADGIWDALNDGGFASTLIVSPPGAGKTTLLRELVRRLSGAGRRVAVADERGEVADGWQGEPGFDVGPCTDVLTGVPKAEGIGLLVRSMNPQVVAVDEIGDTPDGQALLAAAGCGVLLLATAHGERDGPESAVCRRLIQAGAFRRRVWVEYAGGRRRYTVERLPCV